VYLHVSEGPFGPLLTGFDSRYSLREKLGVDDVRRESLALRGAKGRRSGYETNHCARRKGRAAGIDTIAGAIAALLEDIGSAIIRNHDPHDAAA
jgi:hypothetical protein